jgi:uncharacterized protein (DUF305 family)
MRPAPRPIAAALLLAAVPAAACARGGTAGAPAPSVSVAADSARAIPAPTPAPTPAAAEGPAPSAGHRSYTAADVRFMRGMIHHHAQALTMTALVPERTTRDDMRLLAQRIEVSQRDEIALMRRWLQDRGLKAPSDEMLAGTRDAMHHAPEPRDSAGRAAMGHHDMSAMHGMAGMAHDSTMPDMASMPGMLTPAQLTQLAAARGADFDRLFLEDMTRHHGGALTMVADLFATPGAGQEPEIFRLASDVEADQRAEIARMRALERSIHGTP